jgi:addiction module RelE/StbE family toxin
LALADFLDAQEYIAQDSPLAAQAVAQRIDEAARGLLDHPHIGRPGHVEGTRERVVSRTPYLIVYRVRGQEIELLRIWHGNQDWQNQPAS